MSNAINRSSLSGFSRGKLKLGVEQGGSGDGELLRIFFGQLDPKYPKQLASLLKTPTDQDILDLAAQDAIARMVNCQMTS